MILEGSGVMNLNPSNHLLHQQPAWTDSYPTCNDVETEAEKTGYNCYQPYIAEALTATHLGTARRLGGNVCPPVSSGFFGGQWHEIHPQYWTKYQVWEWLQHLLDTNQLDANCIPFQEFDINGEHLCSMTLQEFTRAAGAAGQILYNNLQHLKWNGQCGSDPFQSTHNVIVKTEQADPSIMTTWKEDNYLYDTNYGSTVEMMDSKTFCRAQISMTTTGHLPIDSPDLKKEQEHPAKSHTKKHNPRGTHLWEFIRDILLNPDKNPGLIKWEDRSEGIFRFLKSEAVAQLWGKKKNNSSMTYEKLSRAMRYYYKREILERVDGRRLVYKFGKNARGWRENEN
ncbi:ETS homologous factor isoform X1 [Antechinus flavipes]|uniref:ETS homologous factor n=1 Tax=Sarcophilus harrisii TaxID=9305 RepID=A0A7N4V6U9_SARHA|nr:ETS homologous factor isoform X1 [Sarcophilus harrisii]XP_031800004.1 ETS homologous factor isoform X1 [Sarcophilus harrisii]XP_031800005.1 ETS homologous factor isoform X1 [Sarcophilus harrisii]XP_031800006.1 ETS homologous factor isoform X1 [Sarcophilus harrisii]XP_051823612.1 ETS homologous factor isoform X1 [Antechinus flavipes]XP_051823613.1 ETS homologous factor isoform X1 [Antechinus flavipes]XP_051823614.1 ETS homologous factor isoform X1 [Antechinus flavipes]